MKKHDESSRVSGAEMAFVRAWAGTLAGMRSKPAAAGGTERYSSDAPFSFKCGDVFSREWIKPGNAACVRRGGWRGGTRSRLLCWRTPRSSISCAMELTEFRDFPALEWVLRLRNDGSADGEPVTDFKALDFSWKSVEKDETPELRRAFGSDARHDDFQYVREELRQSMWSAPQTVRMDTAANTAFRKTRNGSPSFLMADSRPSATWLPFFNLRTGADGLVICLGWSGRWFAEFAHDGAGGTAISAGMEHLALKLRPGEEIRSPRVLLLYWRGAPLHGHNMLRQFILRFHSPRINGRLPVMPVCNGAWGGTPTPGHMEAIESIARHGLDYDYYWMDAGWYGTSDKPCPNVFQGEWWITGDWRVNRNYHPAGLKPVSDAVRRAGMKFLLWAEPERAKHGTPFTLGHPEWFLRRTKEAPKPNDDLLLNLGHPEAWQWAVATISQLIAENGIDCYREDFNIDPGPFWDNADEEGREGMTEMRFIEGLYAFWDELRRRHPKLLIDNCASGGRRLELETISRSVALWRTDYNCFPFMKPEASQLHGAGLNLWLPLNAISPMAKPGDTYQARSAFSAGLVLNINEFGLSDSKAPDFPWDWFRKMIGEAKRLRQYFLGDFHPLTPCVIAPEAWMAYQLLVPEKQEGAVLAFRRPESSMAAATFLLHGLQAEADYEFEDADTGRSWRAAGRSLLTRGLEISIGAPRASRLLFYRKLS